MTEPRAPEVAAPPAASLVALRDILAAAGISADKRFGQHFLLDLNICRKIVRLADIVDGQAVIEVGPGPGGLTRALLEAGARVAVVEKDPRFIPLLEDLAVSAQGRLTVIEGDALDIDELAILRELNAGSDGHVVSNLPYNVGTPLLVKWLTGDFRPLSMTLMFQKEVAQRIVASAGQADYGRLAVLAQTICDVRNVMALPARAFTPPPKVASAVVRLTPLDRSPPRDLVGALQHVARAAFGQRRKMLRSSVRFLGGEQLCIAAGVDPDARAETISVAGFMALAEAWIAREA